MLPVRFANAPIAFLVRCDTKLPMQSFRNVTLLPGLALFAALAPVVASAQDLPVADLSAISRQDSFAAGMISVAQYHLPAAQLPDGPATDMSRISMADYPVAPANPAATAQGTGLIPAYGPQDSTSLPAASPGGDAAQFRSFGEQVGAVKWEVGAALLFYTATNGAKLFEDPQWPHFHSEGWFGTDTNNMGVDKLAHSYSSYVLSELFHARLRRKTSDAPGIAVTAAALGFGTMLYTELWDSIEPTAGWSWEDVAFNGIGAGFSILRNTVPGLDRKLDFRLLIQPQEGRYRLSGKRHFEAQYHFLALKLAGFEGLQRTPLRLLELDLGYHASDFTNPDREAGIKPRRHIFIGASVNFNELFGLRGSTSAVARAAGSVLEYLQPPYTMVHTDLTD